MNFGLMFFAASEDALGSDKYRLVVDSAKFADAAGFSSVWVPERHFGTFGGLYPNPAVLHAGLATCTSRIGLRAGSVVAPLHHPLRIAEEWSVVDNLSHGRVGVSFASGWNPDDFMFFPDRYANRHEQVIDVMEQVRRLWRGEPFEGTNGVGAATSVRVFPKPVQAELPVWMTVAGNPRSFERAGASGANLLTHLLDQDEDVLAARIALYRQARGAAGFDPATGIVSLMIHTFVGADAGHVREQARAPYCNYIKANIGLFRGLELSRGRDVDLSTLSGADLDEFVNYLYDRFAASRGLIGTPETCAPLVRRLAQAGVNELACLLDFGPEAEVIIGHLPHLARLKDVCQRDAEVVAPPTVLFDRAAAIARCPQVMTGDQFHRVLGRYGIQIGGVFRTVETVWRAPGEAVAQLSLPTVAPGYHVPPAALDACGRVLAAALPAFGTDEGVSYLPAGLDQCDLSGDLAGEVWVHARLSQTAPSVIGDVSAYDTAGRLLARLSGLRFNAVPRRSSTPDAGQLMYERAWKPASMNTGTGDASGRWLVIPDAAGLAAALTELLEAQGGQCVTSASGDLRGVIYLQGLDAPCEDDALEAVSAAVARAVQGALQLSQSGSAPLWFVTRGAVPVVDRDRLNVAQAPLWGFGRAVAVDRAGGLVGLVDLDPAASATASARHLLDVLTGDRREDMVAFRSGTAYVPRLVRTPTAPARPRVPFGDAGTVLVTGGTGGLGLQLSAWLISRGARHLLLCGRRSPTATAAATIDEWRAAGVHVDTVCVDVADFDALATAIADTTRPPVTSVFHLAGVLDDGRVEEQTWERFAGVFGPKVDGAWNLHRLTLGDRLQHFVLFSSVSSLMPAPGQTSYAAANAFLDGLSHYRRSLGLPSLAVNWGPWSGAGHAETDYGRQAHARLATLGIGAIDPARGFEELEAALTEGRPQVAVVPVDWAMLASADPAAARLGLIADLVGAPAALPSKTRPAPSALLNTLAALPPGERRPHLMQFLSDMVIAALRLRTDEPLDGRQRLFDVGLDSIMALELKDRLERAVGAPLSATLLFVHPTLDALCDYLLADIVPAPVAPASLAAESEADLTRRLLQEIANSRGT